MSDDFDLEVQGAALTVVRDYEKTIRREKLIMLLKCNVIIVVAATAVACVLKKYNEEDEES